MKDIKKTYSNEEIEILWQPKMCIHSAECVKALPGVFKPKDKPWIVMENGSTDDIKNAVDRCPSGALSYKMKNSDGSSTSSDTIPVLIKENGPLVITGDIEVTLADGSLEKREKRASFCRCGLSKNQPYCDDAHKESDFVG